MSRNLSARYKTPRRWCSKGGHWAPDIHGHGKPWECKACTKKDVRQRGSK